MTSIVKYSYILFVLIFLFGCDAGPMVHSDSDVLLDQRESELVYQKSLGHLIMRDTLILNPTGYTPLSAELKLETTQPVQVELEIESPYKNEEHLIHRFKEISTSLTLPVLGLYASHTNILHIRFYDSGNQLLGGETRMIDTQELFIEPPTIDVIVNTKRKKPGMNLVSFSGRTNPSLPQLPFMFDQYGHIRWYADMKGHPILNGLTYDVGVERLQNGNFYFGDKHTDRIFEMDMLGRVVNQWLLEGYSFHHHVLELPSGNLLATVSLDGIPTIEDHIIEIDRNSGNIANVWDLRESVYSRHRLGGNPRDWFHGNGLAYDEEQDAIIVSGRNRGTVKLTRDNEVIWIFAQHRAWSQTEDGMDLKTKLLQPLDANGRPITDLRVLAGYSNHSDFLWPWTQHAPKLTPQGTLFLFDNGYYRNYTEVGPRFFSRAVEYRIDEDAMTVQQVWEYGRERGNSTFAARVSDVDYHPDENTVAFMPGDIFDEHGRSGRIVEVDHITKDVVYEAILHKRWVVYFMFHRMERLSIYPDTY